MFGIVKDGNSAPVFGSIVTLRNERTGDVLSTTTDSLGQYQVDLTSMTGGFQTGDIIAVKAASGNQEGTASVTVSTLPLDQCDIVLSEKNGINPIVIGGVVIGLIALIILAILYSRHSKNTGEEPKEGRGKE